MAKDPICGMQVDEKSAKSKSDYMGKTYYLCCHLSTVALWAISVRQEWRLMW